MSEFEKAAAFSNRLSQTVKCLSMYVYLDTKPKHELIDLDDINSPIYRVLEISRLIDVFELKVLGLTAPKLWDDPYENFLKYSHGINLNDNRVHYNYEGYSKLIFGQCWTLNEENDAIWRIYSPNKDRVKVRTTIKKLQKVLKRIQDEGFRSYIGRVKYETEDDIKAKISTAIKNSHKFPFNKESLVREYYLVKREAFIYEDEVRLLLCLPRPSDDIANAIYQDPDNLDICNLPLEDPGELFDEIVFDPRMPDSLVRAFTSYFMNVLKFKKEIRKSDFYQKPDIKEKVRRRAFGTFFRL